ncbi:MAG: 3'(2'),5'-bisphosphate nucleotidase CysQ, partial [Nitrospinota bacterium]
MEWHKEGEVLQEAVIRAGQAVLRLAREGFETARKSNQDPVTTADFTANRILKEMLLDPFPGYGWLSEETRDNPERLGRRRVWIVDPIDGTKEFVGNIPEFAVSVALVEAGKPVLGAVYNPARGELFTAIKGQGAWLNGEQIQANHRLTERPVILASRSEIGRGEFQPFE